MHLSERGDPSFDGRRYEVVVTNAEVSRARYLIGGITPSERDKPSTVLRWLADMAEAQGD